MAALDTATAEAAVADGLSRYFAERRARVDAFVDRHFSLRGTLRLHRAAIGWDIARAPANLSLAAPQLLMRVASRAAGKLGAQTAARHLGRSILLQTDVAREISWLITTELLELPCTQPGRVSTRDAMADAIAASPILARAMRDAWTESGHPGGDDPGLRERLVHALTEYTGSRAAAAEITTGLLSLTAGAAALNKITPGAASLGPAIAAMMAHQAAIASFPLGAWLGGVWYGLFPLAPSVGLVAGTTGGLMAAAASFAAFSGVVSDPIQRALGLHRARLLRMIAALERQVADPAAPAFTVRDHYVARLLDVFDYFAMVMRLVQP